MAKQVTLDKLITSPIRDTKFDKASFNKMSQLEMENLAICIGSLARLCHELRINGRPNVVLAEACRTMVEVLIKEQEKQ